MASPSDRRPIVVSGPSGVGKGTLIKLLFSRHPDIFTLSVSHTTRSPRAGEQDGVDYHYVTKEEFKDLISQDKFVEQYVCTTCIYTYTHAYGEGEKLLRKQKKLETNG